MNFGFPLNFLGWQGNKRTINYTLPEQLDNGLLAVPDVGAVDLGPADREQGRADVAGSSPHQSECCNNFKIIPSFIPPENEKWLSIFFDKRSNGAFLGPFMLLWTLDFFLLSNLSAKCQIY